MKKDFITVSPDTGGTTQVNVVADPNSTLQSRSTTLNPNLKEALKHDKEEE